MKRRRVVEEETEETKHITYNGRGENYKRKVFNERNERIREMFRDRTGLC